MFFILNHLRFPTAKTAALGLLAATLALPVLPLQAAEPQAGTPHPLVAYYDTSAGMGGIQRIPWANLTHVNVAFAGISPEGTCAWMDLSGNDSPAPQSKIPATIQALIAARNQYNPNAKLVLSVGGWTMSYRFSQATSTPAGAAKLAKSCVAMMNQYNLDGLDYDWEYPTKVGKQNCPPGLVCQSDNDPAQMTELLGASRLAMGVDVYNHPLSVAVYAVPGSEGIPYDVKGMDPYLTYWNIMAYDMAAPSWSTGTAFHAPMMGATQTLAAYAALGATPQKLNLGVPFYGYIWFNAPTPGIDVFAPGNATNYSQYSSTNLIRRYNLDPGCKTYNDRNGQFTFCTSGTHQGEWAAIDYSQVLFDKASFVKQNNFGGVMIWSIQGDTQLGDLTATIYGALNPG